MRLRFALGLFAAAHGSAVWAQSYTFAPLFPSAGAWSIVVDSAGTLYSAASGRHAVFKYPAGGTASTFAGAQGLPGFVDGVGNAARFNLPTGVTLDSVGNLFVADTDNRAIRKISPAGAVTTLTDGNAAFSRPVALAVDRLGNVYVPDAHAIRKVTPGGAVSTLAGAPGAFGFVDGEGDAARFASPVGIAIDSSGNLFVVDYTNKAVRKVTPAGTVTTLARNMFVVSIAVDRGGNVYVQDGNTDYNEPVFIRRITQAGTITTLAQVGGNGGLAFDPAGNLHSVDSEAGMILRGRPDANEAPALVIQPQSQTVAAGQRAIFAVSATGAPLPDFQWMKDGVALAGATEAALHIEPEGAFARDGGRYTCVVSNSVGRVTSAEARLTVTASPELPRPGLSNLSLRAQVTAGSPLVTGFVVGPGAGKTVLVRAVGPTLAALGVTGPLADPRLELFDRSGGKIAENDNAGPDAAAMAAAVGAFPLAADGTDAALVATLPPGSYTAQIAGAGGAGGVALVEIYEADSAGSRILNLSARAPVGTDDSVLLSGFTVAPGAGTRPLLIRALGASLASFGVTGALGDPTLELFSGPSRIAENDNWGSPIGPGAADAWTFNAVFAQTGAFPLGGGSRDAALLVDLPAGSYTLQVRGVGGGTGQAQVEIYEATIPSVVTDPGIAARVAVQSFTVIGRRAGGRFIYQPQLRLVEVTGADSAVVGALEFRLEGGGPAGRVPVWTVQKTIPAGGTLEMINPNFYGDYEFEFDSDSVEADYVSVAITYRDRAGRTGVVSSITRVNR